MDKQFVATSASPQVTLQVSGNLRLKGQDTLEVTAKADSPENLTLETRDDQVVLRSQGDCTVRVPRLATIHVHTVQGEAVIKALEGNLTIDTINGNLQMRNVAETKISQVNGETSVKNLDGNLSIDRINGDMNGRGIQGDCLVTSAHGNLNLSDVGGDARATADGNITLRLDPAPGHQFEFSSHSNVFCRLSEDASVEISVTKASQVMTNLPGIHATAPVQAPYALTLGEGDAKLSLSADGNVILDTHAPDWGMEDFDIDVGSEVEGMADVISEQINEQVESQMRMMEDQLNAQLSSLSMRLSAAKLTEEQIHHIEERAHEASERASARAQEKMRRAQAKMEQKMAAMQRRMEQKNRDIDRASRHAHRGWNFKIPTPAVPTGSPEPPTQMGEPVSEDERILILRMLEEKKITLEEAEQLLSALEGKE